MKQEMSLTREHIEARHNGPPPAEEAGSPLLPEAEVEASLDAAVARADNGGLWLFAYGSLMWRPEFPFEERRIARVRGFHRRFCLWQWRWRGSEKTPNLMLALAPGGSCTGLAYRITGPGLRDKLGPVWRRELSGDGYRPRWMNAATDLGPIRMVGFAVNRGGGRYAGRLPDDQVARTIADARGSAGTGAEYLLLTTAAVEALGVRDRMLWRLQGMVADKLK